MDLIARMVPSRYWPANKMFVVKEIGKCCTMQLFDNFYCKLIINGIR